MMTLVYSGFFLAVGVVLYVWFYLTGRNKPINIELLTVLISLFAIAAFGFGYRYFEYYHRPTLPNEYTFTPQAGNAYELRATVIIGEAMYSFLRSESAVSIHMGPPTDVSPGPVTILTSGEVVAIIEANPVHLGQYDRPDSLRGKTPRN